MLFSGGARGGDSGPGVQAAMAEAVGRCMSALLEALRSKAGAYKDKGGGALAALFLLNNAHYLVDALEQSERLSLLGRAWLQDHKAGGPGSVGGSARA